MVRDKDNRKLTLSTVTGLHTLRAVLAINGVTCVLIVSVTSVYMCIRQFAMSWSVTAVAGSRKVTLRK